MLMLLAPVSAALPGCAAAELGPQVVGLPVPDRPVVLLGEVHDNAQQHRERLQVFEALLATGARPALAMEQLDRDRQAAIDALSASGAVPTADAVIGAAGPAAGWNWDFYRPFVAAALKAGVPIVAANVSRDDARRVMREGLAPLGFDPAVPADVLAQHAEDIVASHCGMVDASTATRMALAQVARERFLARVLAQHAARGVVLLAGNGHVRKDIGVPRWLLPEVRANSQAIGWLEAADAAEPPGAAGAQRPEAFDVVRITPRQARPDPCASMRKQLPAPPKREAAR